MMSFYKRVICFIILLPTLLLFSGCFGFNMSGIYEDDTKIAAKADSRSFSHRLGSTSDNQSKITYDGFTGAETIWNIESESDGSITIEYNSQVDKGDFKLVIIDPQNKVENIFEYSGEGTEIIDIKKGKSRIKIVGKESKGEFSLKINKYNDGIVIRKVK